MFLEDLPMWGYIGEVEGEDLLLGHLETARRYLYPHLHFSIGYNVDQIVSVNVSTNPQRKVSHLSAEIDVLCYNDTFGRTHSFTQCSLSPIPFTPMHSHV